MGDGDKEMGAILESIANLTKVSDRLEYKLDALKDAFTKHPQVCREDMDKRYVTVGRFEPIEEAYKSITAKIYSAAGVGIVTAIGIAFIKG